MAAFPPATALAPHLAESEAGPEPSSAPARPQSVRDILLGGHVKPLTPISPTRVSEVLFNQVAYCSFEEEMAGDEIMCEEDQKLFLQQLPAWDIFEGKLRRRISFPSFVEAVAFIPKLEAVATEEKHHPDVHITNCCNVTVEIWSRAQNCLTEKDYLVAARLEWEIPDGL